MYKSLYSRFLSAQKDIFHMASHSHHYWPDITRDAQLQYWDDSAKYVDDKWGHIFGKVLPELQQSLASVLNIKRPNQIVFAPNTHELVYRILSCFQGPLKILTTDSEFYSFERQMARMEETRSPQLQVTRIPQFPIESFETRFKEALNGQEWNIVFISQVFFNSGFAPDWKSFVNITPSSTCFILDAYHGFMALPTDLAAFENRIFYIGGAYKYAQGGEGCCFMSVPNAQLKPEYTGWFAELGNLNNKQSGVPFSEDGFRFAGSTMDYSAAYRLLAVLKLFESRGIKVSDIHSYIQSCQKEFLAELEKQNSEFVRTNKLLFRSWDQQGHFLTFQLSDNETTLKAVQALKQKKIWVDSRKDRLRFGFGLYHSPEDYKSLDLLF